MSRTTLAIVLALLATASALAVLRWVIGHTVDWQDAYVALQAGEVMSPARGGDERLRLANAMAEGEPPKGMPLARRLHPPGTLVHMRYERLEADGRVASTTEVRALVPSLPYFGEDAPGSDLGKVECPRRCSEMLAANDAVRIARGGSPGLAAEWVLRMPVGQAFDLGTTSFTLQDLEDPRPISLPQARYRATLVEACPARTRVGAVTRIDFPEGAFLPIPRGFKTSRWVQLEGCAALAKRAPPRERAVKVTETAAPLQAPPYAYRPPELGILAPRRGGRSGAELIVDETRWLRLNLEKMHVIFKRACRHEAAGNRWLPTTLPEGPLEVSGPGLMGRTRVAYRFGEAPGLYWAEWSEAVPGEPEGARQYAVVVPVGTTVHCREGELPPPAAGEISLCVPQQGGALPGVVPDPSNACPR